MMKWENYIQQNSLSVGTVTNVDPETVEAFVQARLQAERDSMQATIVAERAQAQAEATMAVQSARAQAEVCLYLYHRQDASRSNGYSSGRRS